MTKECQRCYHENSDSTSVCENCNSPLPDAASQAAPGVAQGVTPTVAQAVHGTAPAVTSAVAPVAALDNAPVLELADLASGVVIRVSGNGTIGRGGDIERGFFENKMYVSTYHCAITLEDGQYKVEQFQTTKNPTLINQHSLTPGVPMILRDGDILKVADVTFRAGIRQTVSQSPATAPLPGFAARAAEAARAADTARPADAAHTEDSALVENAGNADTAQSTLRYVIKCPACGSEHEVSSIDARLAECEDCDEYDKKRIASVGAIAR